VGSGQWKQKCRLKELAKVQTKPTIKGTGGATGGRSLPLLENGSSRKGSAYAAARTTKRGRGPHQEKAIDEKEKGKGKEKGDGVGEKRIKGSSRDD